MEAQPIFWAGVFVDRLYAHCDGEIRTALTPNAVQEMRQYNTPPAAVFKIAAATLMLLGGQHQKGEGALASFDEKRLDEWKGVRTMLNEAMLQAVFAFEPAACPQKRWAKVMSMLDGVTVRDAMRSSYPLAVLFRWIKVSGLLANKQDLINAGHRTL